jgi:lipopolysaccharide transport system ATP-binding protein
VDAIVVDNVSKKFKIPHEKKTTLFQNVVGLVRRQFAYEEFWALKGISFSVEQGEVFGIIGRNGSGKTTLLKILANVLYSESGSVTMNGRVAPFLELGVGFQPELTAAENVYIYCCVLGMSRKEAKSKYDDIFDFAELRRFESMKLKNFSSGMYLRLAFSTAIHTNPDTLLIDEVLAVGDEAFQQKCKDKMQEFKRQGKTIVFVSHALDAVESLCQRSLLLDDGRIISIGKTEEVIGDYLEMLRSEWPIVPSAPTLISPDDGATVYGTSVNFRWNPSDGATKYFLVVSTSPNFIQTKPRIFSDFVGDALSHTVAGFPNDGTTYYWWVWGGNEAGITHHSDTRANGRSFINGEAPTISLAPTLISPDEGEQF